LEAVLVQGDITDPDSLVRAFTGAEAVFHFAGSISLQPDSWREMEAINITGTHNVVKACLQCRVPRLVYCSSIHALEQEPLSLPVDEKRDWNTGRRASPYDRSKAQAEMAVQAGISAGLDAVILNPTAVVGPNDYKPSYVGRSILQLTRGEIPVLVQGGFDWVDARDVAFGAIQAWLKAPQGRRYILSGHWMSVRDVARLVAQESGRSAPRLVVPLWLAYLVVPIFARFYRLYGRNPIFTRVSLQALRSNRHVQHDRAARELGYTARSMEETINDTLAWFKANNHAGARNFWGD
jgi:dihydroflavonol-4-reductase